MQGSTPLAALRRYCESKNLVPCAVTPLTGETLIVRILDKNLGAGLLFVPFERTSSTILAPLTLACHSVTENFDNQSVRHEPCTLDLRIRPVCFPHAQSQKYHDTKGAFGMRPKILLFVILSTLAVTGSLAQSSPAPSRGHSVHEYQRLPLTFESNQGQTNSEVRFLARGQGYTAFLTAGGIALSLRRSIPGADAGSDIQRMTTSKMVQLTLVGALKDPVIVGEDPQPGRVNYFLGKDPSKWQTDVPTYGRVRQVNVYPGIDLLYHGTDRQLEYDFEVRPGADPRAIKFEIQGAEQIKLDPQGNLVLKMENGELRLQCPVVYQKSYGRQVVVDGAYAVEDSTHVSFEVAHYDASKPLVIDPVLIYASYLGGTGADQANGIAVDSTGSVYLAGTTTSVDFPGANLGSLAQNTNHVFVAKFNAAGTQLVYADYIGGNNADAASALVLDSRNDVYVTGSTQSSNFPVINAFQSTQPGPNSGFLTQVSADGSTLLYSTYLGGNTLDQPTGIAIDSANEVYVAGYTMSTNFPVENAYQPAALANGNGTFGTYGFLTKFSAGGASLVYSTYFAGNLNGIEPSPNYRASKPIRDAASNLPPSSEISALALDANGNAYLAGTTNTYNFPTTAGAYLTSYSVSGNTGVGFVSKFSGTGTLDYSTYFYGSNTQDLTIAGIAVDATGSAYITGDGQNYTAFPITTTSICDPETYSFACGPAFVAKFDSPGATLLYSTCLGPFNYSYPEAITLDSSNDAYIVAQTGSSDFQTSNAIEAYSNQKDLIVVEIDPGASTQLFATYLGGSGNDSPGGIAVDANGNIYVAGTTSSTDFPITQGAFQGQLTGSTNTFVAKIGTGIAPTVSLSPDILQFSPLPVGSTSQPQQVTVRNMSNLTLALESISASGDFASSGNCGPSLPPTGICTLSVTFTPSTVGTRAGLIQSSDSGTSSPQLVSLSGTGLGAVASFLPSTVGFAGVPVGTTATSAVALTNQGNIALSISSVQISGNYSQTNNCPASVAGGARCTFNIVFAPTATGSQSGSLTLTSNAVGGLQTIFLSGTGSDFSLASPTNSATVQAGNTAAYTVNVAPVGGAFNNAVTLTCSGVPANSACSISPSSVTPGTNRVAATVTIRTAASSSAATRPKRQQPMFAMWLSGLGIFGILLTGSKRSRNKRAALLMLALLIAPVLFMAACAGGTGIAPQMTDVAPGTYHVTVIGASGADQHSIPLTLVVQ
jgi:hypothetical protein